ncbi:hypothetical protein OAS89_03380 [Alphaproteobacteria bacterium]|nr:hypothetical protein [Alphaproteobacteria bacterium]
MKQTKRQIFAVIVMGFLFNITAAKSDVWTDEDGASFVQIKEGMVSIYSLNDFYHFDQIFTTIRNGKSKIRVCIGENIENKTGMPTDCFIDIKASYSFHNKGKSRAIHAEMFNYPFILKAFEEYLGSGNTMKISIDNNDLYYASILNINYKLTAESEAVLKLPD